MALRRLERQEGRVGAAGTQAFGDLLLLLQREQDVGLSADASFLPLPSPQGHDAFLVDFDRFAPAVRGFLDTL